MSIRWKAFKIVLAIFFAALIDPQTFVDGFEQGRKMYEKPS